MTVLVTAVSTHGSTGEIAQAIGAALTEHGVPAVVRRRPRSMICGVSRRSCHLLCQPTDPVDLPRIRAVTGAREHRMFPGRLDRRNLPVAQRMALAAFPGMRGDFRDWNAVRAWSPGIAEALQHSSAR